MADLEATVRGLADKEAIRDLARRYAHCVWQQDADGAVGLFVEDGSMDMGDRPPIKGHEALRAAYTATVGVGDFQPFVHNHIVELDGDRASGTCYLDLRVTAGDQSMIGSGYYNDHYVRTNSGWRFQSRKLTLRFLVPIQQGWAKKQEGGE